MDSILRPSSIVLASASLCVASSAFAATPGGPPIAYALLSGYTQSIYLTNPDGSAKVKLYTTANKVNIGDIDVRPGGNQLAIIEGSIAGGQGVLKIINYTDAGVRGTVTTVSMPGCTAQGIDYHPGDGSLLVARYCNSAAIQEVRRYTANGWDTDPLFQVTNGNPDKAAGKVRWMGDGTGFLWAESDTVNGGRIDRHMLSNTYAPVTIYQTGSLALPTWFDVAHCGINPDCAKLLVTNQSGQINEITFDGVDHGTLFSSAADGHYSQDNAHILYRVSTKASQQLKIDGTVLVAKGTFAGKDWRQ